MSSQFEVIKFIVKIIILKYSFLLLKITNYIRGCCAAALSQIYADTKYDDVFYHLNVGIIICVCLLEWLYNDSKHYELKERKKYTESIK